MRSILRTLLMIVGLQFVAALAWANLDVSCLDDDCLRHGWQTVDLRSGDSSLVVCHDEDCTVNGWYNEYKSNIAAEVICKPAGCFTEGWQAFDNRSGRMVADVSCQTSFAANDCLRFGWTTYEPGRGTYNTRCIRGNCREFGWDVFYPGFAPQPVRCKRGGCFVAGWTVFR